MELTNSIFFRPIKYSAIAFTALTLAGIAALMFIARNKDEDIAGIVASALFLAIFSTVVAIAAAILQRSSVKRERGTSVSTNDE